MGDVVPMQYKELTPEEFAKLTEGIDVAAEVKRATDSLRSPEMTERQPIEARLRLSAEAIPHELWTWLNPLLLEAAAEIEQLRKDLDEASFNATCDWRD